MVFAIKVIFTNPLGHVDPSVQSLALVDTFNRLIPLSIHIPYGSILWHH